MAHTYRWIIKVLKQPYENKTNQESWQRSKLKKFCCLCEKFKKLLKHSFLTQGVLCSDIVNFIKVSSINLCTKNSQKIPILVRIVIQKFKVGVEKPTHRKSKQSTKTITFKKKSSVVKKSLKSQSKWVCPHLVNL